MKYVFKNPLYKRLMPIFDAIGCIIFSPFKIFIKARPDDPKSILVVRLDHIGDFVCTTPLFKNLKKEFPDARITVLVNSVSKELAYRDPNIDKVITYSPPYLARGDRSFSFKALLRIIKDVRNIGFDLGIDPRGDLLSILIMFLGGVKYRAGYGITGGGFLLHKEGKYNRNAHIVDRNLNLLKDLNISIEDDRPAVYFNEKDGTEVERLLEGKGVRPIQCEIDTFGQTPLLRAIVLHPFAGAEAKEWPRENFHKLIERLKGDGYSVLLVGSKSDIGIFEGTIDLRGALSLPQLAYLIKRTGFFIGLDSGPANIAAALGVPAVVICSGTNIPQLWIPNNPNVKIVYKDMKCKPCENKVCTKVTHECMDGITVDEVLEKFKEIAWRKMGHDRCDGSDPIKEG